MRYVVFDLETERLAGEVGGWGYARAMGMAVGVSWSEGDGYRSWLGEGGVPGLVGYLGEFDLVVGFNHVGFDYEVLRGYGAHALASLNNLDILVEVARSAGKRVGLGSLAYGTLGCGKTGSGKESVAWVRAGRLDLVEAYCREDVRLTRDLYLFGRAHGSLVYRGAFGKLGQVRVSWK